MQITLTIDDNEYKTIEETAKSSNKTVDNYLAELILDKTNRTKIRNIKNDPFYNIKGFSCNAPEDLAENHDSYLYKI